MIYWRPMKTPPRKSPRKQKSVGEKKKTYKVRNWKEYNEALVNRGRITLWITDETIKKWEERKKTGKRGKPRTFSAAAVTTALTLRQVLRLPLRQTEGFLASVLLKIGAAVKAPDFTTLCIRSRTLPVAIRVRPIREGSLHIVVDSTGAKVYGEGEWKVRQHGWSRHRRWKKLHIGVDEATGDILLGEVTGNDMTDGETLPSLLAQLPGSVAIAQCSADGAYDKRMCYDALRDRGVSRITIPPRHDAKIWRHANTGADRLARDENLRRIRAIGRASWKRESGYHRRSLAETAMFRLKTIFGDKVQARHPQRQRAELLLRCRALNMMTALGMPDAHVVA